MTERAILNGTLPPNSTIGIIGGGQLGRMLASSAARLGFRTLVLEPGKDFPAAQVCNGQIVAAYDDADALDQLADQCDVVTYEFENVPLLAAQQLEGLIPLYPPSLALEVSQDRLREKKFLNENDIAVAPFANVETENDLVAALKEFNGGVLKTRRFGYDGKGQHVFDDAENRDAWKTLSELGKGPFVLEQKIDFLSEFSIIAARNTDGDIVAFDPATNVHESGILRQSMVPARIKPELAEKAAQVAHTLLNALEYVGVVGVEFFETENGLLVNEFAPRVHNSGHWTVEACAVSQFDQHIRAICGLPLGSTARHHDCEMENLLGDEALSISEHLEDRNVQVTLYGKLEARPGRKMGHFTRLL